MPRALPPVLAALAVVSAAAPARAAGPRVALIDSAEPQTEGRQELRAAVVQALRELGAEVVPQAHLKGLAAGGCAEATCFQKIAQATAAAYLLRLDGDYAGDGFRLRLELREGRSGRVLSSDGRECEVCAAEEFPHTARERTTVLCARAFQEHAAPAPAAPAAAISAATVPPVRPLWRQPLPVAGAGVIAAGLVGAAVGVHLLSVDGDLACEGAARASCVEVRDTGAAGRALLAGGVVAALGGGALVYWGRDRTRGPAVAIGPDRVTLRFRM